MKISKERGPKAAQGCRAAKSVKLGENRRKVKINKEKEIGKSLIRVELEGLVEIE